MILLRSVGKWVFVTVMAAAGAVNLLNMLHGVLIGDYSKATFFFVCTLASFIVVALEVTDDGA